jgi:hypothetical protein
LRCPDRPRGCTGRWTAQTLDGIEHRLDTIAWPTARCGSISGGVEFDTVGAWLLNRTARTLRRSGRDVSLEGADPAATGCSNSWNRTAARAMRR